MMMMMSLTLTLHDIITLFLIMTSSTLHDIIIIIIVVAAFHSH